MAANSDAPPMLIWLNEVSAEDQFGEPVKPPLAKSSQVNARKIPDGTKLTTPKYLPNWFPAARVRSTIAVMTDSSQSTLVVSNAPHT
jgi:hypothetical protein